MNISKLINKRTRFDGWVKIILIIITLIAVGFSVYTYVQTEERKEKDAATIRNQVDVILQSRALIKEHEKRIAQLKKEIKYDIDVAELYRDSLNTIKESIYLRDEIIVILKNKLEEYENVIIIDLTDDEHLDLFLEWSNINW